MKDLIKIFLMMACFFIVAMINDLFIMLLVVACLLIFVFFIYIIRKQQFTPIEKKYYGTLFILFLFVLFLAFLSSKKIEEPLDVKIQIRDIKNSSALLSKLKKSNNQPFLYMYNNFSTEFKKIVNAETSSEEIIRANLAKELDNLLSLDDFFNEERFVNVVLSEETSKYLNSNILNNKAYIRNRLLIEDAFPDEILSRQREKLKEILNKTNTMETNSSIILLGSLAIFIPVLLSIWNSFNASYVNGLKTMVSLRDSGAVKDLSRKIIKKKLIHSAIDKIGHFSRGLFIFFLLLIIGLIACMIISFFISDIMFSYYLNCFIFILSEFIFLYFAFDVMIYFCLMQPTLDEFSAIEYENIN